jgi:hypothetical protein
VMALLTLASVAVTILRRRLVRRRMRAVVVGRLATLRALPARTRPRGVARTRTPNPSAAPAVSVARTWPEHESA